VGEFVVSIGAIVILMMKRFHNQFWPMLTASLLVIIGGFFHRLLVLYVALNTHEFTLESYDQLWVYPAAVGEFIEGAPSFVTYWPYSPSLVEWIVTLLPIGINLLVIGIIYPKIREKYYTI
jgi:Ni/Fe-hydrogenase subunit HybB-like protein